jgi:voltage-dependent anion channel protein 2
MPVLLPSLGNYSVFFLNNLQLKWLLYDSKKSAKAKTEYKHEILSANFDVDLDMGAPVVHGASVFGYNGWLAGYQMSFDTAKSKLLKNNFAVAYECKDFALHTSV